MKAVIGIDSSAPGGLRPRTPTREQSPLDPNLLRSHSLPARRSGSLPTVAFAPCASLSRSLPAGQSSNSRWTCPLPSAFRRPPSVRDGRRQTGGQRTGVFQMGRRRGGEVTPPLLNLRPGIGTIRFSTRAQRKPRPRWQRRQAAPSVRAQTPGGICPLPSTFRRPHLRVRDGRRQTGGQDTGVFKERGRGAGRRMTREASRCPLALAGELQACSEGRWLVSTRQKRFEE